jgi:antitoxin YefM
MKSRFTLAMLTRWRARLYNYSYNWSVTMDVLTYSTARATLADTMDRVCEDHEPVIITRNREQSVVMMSLDDFNALEETAYLLRNPKNARRLLASIASLEAGKGKERKLPQ